MFFEIEGRPGFLDWQAWQEGPYMHDVAYSIIGNLKVEDRRAAEKDLLAGYLTALKAHGVANPPSREDAWEAYRSEEHTSELQSLMRISYDVFCLKKKQPRPPNSTTTP